jgi:hypothetical protein
MTMEIKFLQEDTKRWNLVLSVTSKRSIKGWLIAFIIIVIDISKSNSILELFQIHDSDRAPIQEHKEVDDLTESY